jgi:hypothetical protein
MVLLQDLVLDLSIMFVHVRKDILVLVVVMVRFVIKEIFLFKDHFFFILDLLNSIPTTYATQCGTLGKPYPSRNPNNPVGCWCNNGTHIEEVDANDPGPYCV